VPVTSFDLTIPANEQALTDSNRTLSVKQKGSFLGFSIELSVAPSISEWSIWISLDAIPKLTIWCPFERVFIRLVYSTFPQSDLTPTP